MDKRIQPKRSISMLSQVKFSENSIREGPKSINPTKSNQLKPKKASNLPKGPYFYSKNTTLDTITEEKVISFEKNLSPNSDASEIIQYAKKTLKELQKETKSYANKFALQKSASFDCKEKSLSYLPDTIETEARESFTFNNKYSRISLSNLRGTLENINQKICESEEKLKNTVKENEKIKNIFGQLEVRFEEYKLYSEKSPKSKCGTNCEIF